MSLLDDADRAMLRAVQSDNFPHRVMLEALESVEKPSGGEVTDWVPYANDVPGRLAPISGREAPLGAVLTPNTNYKLVLPYGQFVSAEHRATVTGVTGDMEWRKVIGVTFVDEPRGESASTICYGSDDPEQINPGA